MAINIELVDGCIGWGEAPVLFPITTEGSAVGYVKGCGSMCVFEAECSRGFRFSVGKGW